MTRVRRLVPYVLRQWPALAIIAGLTVVSPLVAALSRVNSGGGPRFSPEVLTNVSGFTGIDGLFRFRPNGTNERGLAVLRVAASGGQIASASPKSFGA